MLAEDPPAEIAEDVELVRVAYEEANAEVQQADPADLAGLVDSGPLADDEVEAAGARVNDWIETSCA